MKSLPTSLHSLSCSPGSIQPPISVQTASDTAAHICGLRKLRNSYATPALPYPRISKTCASVRDRTRSPPLLLTPGCSPPTISVPCTVAHACGLRNLRNSYATPASSYPRISKTCASVRNRMHSPSLLLTSECSPPNISVPCTAAHVCGP
jgi:hypothetical protein